MERSRGGKWDGASSSSSHYDVSSLKINSSLYQLYAPEPPLKADIDILFFHGLLLGDALDHVAHITTWRSLDKKEEIWPQCWLPQDYSHARVIVVSYDAHIQTSTTEGRMDLHLIGESLLSDIILARENEGSLRPLILVGHCFGGLVIKQLCVHAKRSLRDEQLNNMFLSNIKGICFYSTPHHGMVGLDHLVKLGSPLGKLVHALNEEPARLHNTFDQLWRFKFRHWDIISICETHPTDEGSSILVPEGSSRYGRSQSVAANHFTVCRPIDKQSTNYQLLIKLVQDCSVKGKIRQAQEVPEIIVGRESVVNDAMKQLQNHTFIGFTGTGGIGKTTTAKILFNILCAEFEFTCFLSDVKLCGNPEEIRTKVKTGMHCDGREVEHLRWDHVRGRKLLLVFDDISKDEHVNLLKELAKDNGNPQSRFIVTSRDRECVRLLSPHIQIQSLDILVYKDARRLFMAYIGLIEEVAMTAWDFRHRGAELRLNTLVDRSLVQIRSYGKEQKFSMHEHIRAMGQRIAREKRRICTWPPAEADLPLLRQYRRGNAANLPFCCWGSALPHLDVQYVRVPVTIEASINQHPRTSLLCNHCKVNGIKLPATTITLLWERTPARSQEIKIIDNQVFRVIWKEPVQEVKIIHDEAFRMICQELVVLELSGHDDSDPDSILSVNHCHLLTNLESLTLRNCKFKQSCCSLLERCWKLRRLSIKSCFHGDQFLHLAKIIVQLTNLERLEIVEKSDEKKDMDLPDLVNFVVQLSTNLERVEMVKNDDTDFLDLDRGELQSDFFALPDCFGSMSSLTQLALESEFLRALPNSFGNLENLSKLSLSCRNLQKLPDSFGDLGCLLSLDLLSDELQELPSSFGSLTSLESLSLKCRKLQRLPQSLHNLTYLEELRFHACEKLEELPCWIWDLENLQKLKFPVCGGLRKVPDLLRRLIHLESLLYYFPFSSVTSSEKEREDQRQTVQEFEEQSQSLLADLRFQRRYRYENQFRSEVCFGRRSRESADLDLELEQKQDDFVAYLARSKYITTW